MPAMGHAPGAQPAKVVTRAAEAPKQKEALQAGVQYILDMVAQARARHAGWHGQRDTVEFRATGGGQVLDRFTTEQLWALGWSVKRTKLGVLLSAKGHEIIATSWPVDPFGEQSGSTTAAANGNTLIAVGSAPWGRSPRRRRIRPDSNSRIRLYCADVERSLIQAEARCQGIPMPSSEIVRMPAHGSLEARQLGAASMEGAAMRCLSYGWEQLRNAMGEWLRCRVP